MKTVNSLKCICCFICLAKFRFCFSFCGHYSNDRINIFFLVDLLCTHIYIYIYIFNDNYTGILIQCDECGDGFKSTSSLKNHINLVHKGTLLILFCFNTMFT